MCVYVCVCVCVCVCALQEAQRRVKRDTLHSPPPADFLTAQAARQAEAQRRRLATMHADLVYIEQLRQKQSEAEQEHQQVWLRQQAVACQAAPLVTLVTSYRQEGNLGWVWGPFGWVLGGVRVRCTPALCLARFHHICWHMCAYVLYGDACRRTFACMELCLT